MDVFPPLCIILLFVAFSLFAPQSLGIYPPLAFSHVTGKSASLSLTRCPAWDYDVLIY